MKQRITKEELRHKLQQTSVPDHTEGWKAMQRLLEANTSGKPRYFFLDTKRLAIAAVLLLLLGFSAWHFIFKKSETPPKSELVLQTGKTPVPHKNKLPLILPKNITKSLVINKVALPVNKAEAVAPPSVFLSSQEKNVSLPFVFNFPKIKIRASDMAVSRHIDIKRSGNRKTITTSDRVLPDIPDLSMDKENADGFKDNHSFHISVRLNANGGASFGQPHQNFNPLLKGTPIDVYPSVYVSKKISEKMAIQAGLAVVSPVAVSGNQLKGSVSNPRRALYAMAAQSKDEFQISRLYYADVPVTVQYHLTSRFTIGSGLQLSILEKVIGEKQRVDYSAANNIMYRAPASPSPQDLTNDKNAEAGIHPLDVRWLGTLKYRISNRWLASFQFQYGLTDISDDKAFLYNHQDRNTVISAGIGFLIQ